MATVLIVEDTELQAALVRGFVSIDHTVAGWARTAKEAVSVAQQRNPDAVVMDLNLEDGNGIEATKMIKAYDEDILVIISTVNVKKEVKKRALDAGADAYLTKPYGRDDLLNVLDRLC
jgi:two-component system chemotaxis response regulator CheY